MDCSNSKNEALEKTTPAEFFEWSVLGDGTVSIDGYKGNDENVVIPAEIGGKRVTAIGDNSFQFSEITSITIPHGVTKMECCAFASCPSLASINIPDSVTAIGEMAFLDCTSLTSIDIPDGVTAINGCTFAGCTSLISITIPDSVTKICDNAFTNCTSLTSINLPVNVKICKNALFGCKSLASINLPDGVNILDVITPRFSEKLNRQKNNTEVNTMNGSNKNEVLENTTPVDKFEWLVLNDGTVKINFYNGEDGEDEKIVIPSEIDGKKVTEIGKYAFADCTWITSVTIPDSVTTIGEGAFSDCEMITSINIPESVTTIGDCAFDSCESLTSITIPAGVTEIGESAFYGCKQLTSINIPDSVTEIGDNAFVNCTSLTSINLPDSVKIGEYAFLGTPLEDKFK